MSRLLSSILLVVFCLAGCKEDPLPPPPPPPVDTGTPPRPDTSVVDSGMDSADAGLDGDAMDADGDAAADAPDTSEPPAPFDDVFNPTHIYLIGNLVTDGTDRRGLLDLDMPLGVGSGFPAEIADPQVDPITRLLRYRAGGELRTFACDVCPATSETFVDNPAGNDLSAIPCDGLTDFWVNPEGSYLYQCATGYRTPDASVSTLSGEVLTYGSTGSVLVLNAGQLSIQRTDELSMTPISRFDGCEYIASRTQATGYMVAVECSGERALWDVTFGGIVVERFTYADLPDGFTFDGAAAINEPGNLLLIGTGPSGDELVELNGAIADIVYTESDDPLLRISMSFLVTGP